MQKGGDDSRLFAIAVATALAFDVDPDSFLLSRMQDLFKYFEDRMMTPFPPAQ